MDYKDFADSYIETKYGKIHYKHNDSKGIELVLLHGLGASSIVWRKLIENLTTNLHIFALDLLGHGNSDKPKIDYNIEIQVEVIKEFIEKTCKKPFIMGHSYGGWIAAYYAYLKLPASGIILEDAAGLKEHFDNISKSIDYEDYKKALLRKLLMENNNDEYVMSSIIENEGSNLLTADILTKIDLPTLIIWGSNDDVIDKKFSYTFNNNIKDSRLVMIEDSDHNPHYTKPYDVAIAINNFINEFS